LLNGQAYGQQAKPVFEYITNNNGLSHNTVYDICQDNRGFMWIATEVGLNRYDGQTIKQYKYSPDNIKTLPSYPAISLVFTTDRKLFVGTTLGLAEYLPETDDFRRVLHKGDNMGHIFAMKQGYENELLINTKNRGAFIYNYKLDKIIPLKINGNNLLGIQTDNHNGYWAFSRFALYRFDRNGELIKEFSVTPELLNSAITYIQIDDYDLLWIGTLENGLFTYNTNLDKFVQIEVCKNVKMYYVRSMLKGDVEGEYWIGTESGLYVVNVKNGKYDHYTQSFNKQNQTINDNAIYKIYRNRQGVYFLGTYFGGVNIVNTRSFGFNSILPSDLPGHLKGKAISVIEKSTDGNLWVATEDTGIAILNAKSNNFKHLLFDPNNPLNIPYNNVHALMMDEGICWAGHFMGGLSKIDIKSGKVKRFIQDISNNKTLSNNFVCALYPLSPDSIMVGTLSGIDIMDKKTETFQKFREFELNDCFVYDIFKASDNRLWICTYNKGIFIYDKTKAGLMEHLEANDNSGLTSNSIISYCIDSKGVIWIGTRDNGLLKYNDKENIFNKVDELLNDNAIYGIVEDEDGFLWISTNKGISRLDIVNSNAIHFNINHGISGNQHNYKSYYKDNNIVYFGSVTGLTWFNPRSIFIPQEIPSVYFSNFRIANEIIKTDSTGVLEQQIDYSKHIKLSYNQNSFTFDFASINYLSSDIEYQYYLEGLEDKWSPLTERRQANYTNIAPGRYTFHLRAVNMINNAISKEKSIIIVVQPPFWASWYAYLIYFIIILSVVYYFYRIYRNRQREKLALAIEKIEKENLKILHQHKMNFFTYISHEFKTPLSIIIASIEMMVTSVDFEMKKTIKRSAERLLSLVNQLMEFRKIESDHAEVFKIKGNIVEFVNQIIELYRPLLKNRNADLNFKVSYTETEISFDYDKLEKIITNLLTNAVKYTPHNGRIDFNFNVESNQIKFFVKDSGYGISESKKKKIFEAFYSERFSNDIVESSGIGLALTASLVKLLNGEISVDSIEGKGSCFTVKLPLEIENNDDITSVIKEFDVDKSIVSVLQPDVTEIDLSFESEKYNKEYTILIAEDNKDLLMLLSANLKTQYHVKCCDNGRDALDYINKKTPDLIITDVMMPLMSGVELCQRIKADNRLSHIPVIMLTAKDTRDDKLEGLQAGADAYIIKPFSMKELEIRVGNILNIQKALKIRLKELTGLESFNVPATNHEQAFIEKMLLVIQNNLEKNELDVQFLANTFKMSRSGLHNKMKAILNISPSEFINIVRVNKAKELINQDETLTFSEIAYKVGFADSAHFTRTFKKHARKTPSEYKRSSKEMSQDKQS